MFTYVAMLSDISRRTSTRIRQGLGITRRSVQTGTGRTQINGIKTIRQCVASRTLTQEGADGVLAGGVAGTRGVLVQTFVDVFLALGP